jgi:hypothetical protein
MGDSTLRTLILTIITAVVATLGLVGIVVVVFETNAGDAPGNGQQIYDAPGCGPSEYDGPGSGRHLLMHRSCLPPKAVIVSSARREDDGWRVSLAGSRSFDIEGDRLVSYIWRTSTGYVAHGAQILLKLPASGRYRFVLTVIDESGAAGSTSLTVNLP